jgi:hypothetical protein
MFWLYAVARSHSRFGKKMCRVKYIGLCEGCIIELASKCGVLVVR